MPRRAREKGAYSTYHIILRGNERRNIFFCEEDKSKFLDILNRVRLRYHCIVEAYCLMDNHVHILLNDNGHDISQIMKSLNISYVYYFNKTYHRVGHLFQDRFQSAIITDDIYLLQVSVYIHQNPVKAGIIDRPENYAWSSMRTYLDKEKTHCNLVNPNRILGMLSTNYNRAIDAYRAYVNKYTTAPMMLDIKADRINAVRNGSIHLASRQEAEKYILNQLAKENMGVDELKYHKHRRDSLIREIRQNSSLTLHEIGEIVGGLSAAAICKIFAKK